MIPRQHLAVCAAILLAFFTGAALAGSVLGDAVQLDHLKTSTRKYAQGTILQAHGTCGHAMVTISGINSEDTLQTKDSSFLDDQEAFTADGYVDSAYVGIRVKVGKKQKKLAIALEDQSLVHCLSTKTGKKLLIGTTCTGNVPECDSPNYYLIDPDRLATDDTNDGCDAKCIDRKLGEKLIKPE